MIDVKKLDLLLLEIVIWISIAIENIFYKYYSF